jgi:HSP20 family protein
MRVIGIERIEIERLRERVRRLVAALQEVMDDAPGLAPDGWKPPADLCEGAEAVVVKVELPGVAAEDVEVKLSGGELRVAGKKKRRAARGVSHLCSERAYGAFERTIPLRWSVKTRGASATLADGLLTVRLPKVADRRGAEYKIPIKDVTSDR